MHSESETEDGHDNKFLKLNVDAGDVGKVSKKVPAAPGGRKGVKFSVGFGEVNFTFQT